MKLRLTLKNSAWSVGSYILTGILALLIRKLFVVYLSDEFLGYEGLFGNLFAIMAIANLGVDMIISYRLYPAFASKNEEQICKLMNIYRVIYRMVGSTILIIGLTIMPLLKFIIRGNTSDWDYIYLVYIIQLITLLGTYLLAYKRVLFIVDQKAYECVKLETIISFLGKLLQIVVIMALKSYLLYLLLNAVISLFINVAVAWKCDRNYHYASQKMKIGKKEIEKEGLFKDIKDNIVQKIGLTVYGSTDNLIISAFLGIGQVALVSNYMLISSSVNVLIEKLVTPFQAMVGNIIYSENIEEGKRLFRLFNYISFFIATIIADCFMVLFNPTIQVWLGEKYLLPYAFSVAFASNVYVGWCHRFLTFFRNSFGKYNIDKKYILFGTILNIVFSLILVQPFGVTGVMAGTVLGHLGFWYGRAKVVYQEYLKEPIGGYMKKQIWNVVVWFMGVVILQLIFMNKEVSFAGYIARCISCIVVPSAVNLVFNFNSNEQRQLIQYTKNQMKKIKLKR